MPPTTRPTMPKTIAASMRLKPFFAARRRRNDTNCIVGPPHMLWIWWVHTNIQSLMIRKCQNNKDLRVVTIIETWYQENSRSSRVEAIGPRDIRQLWREQNGATIQHFEF